MSRTKAPILRTAQHLASQDGPVADGLVGGTITMAFFRRFVKEFDSLLPRRVVLVDLGCGTYSAAAYWLTALAEAGITTTDIYGVELSAARVFAGARLLFDITTTYPDIMVHTTQASIEEYVTRKPWVHVQHPVVLMLYNCAAMSEVDIARNAAHLQGTFTYLIVPQCHQEHFLGDGVTVQVTTSSQLSCGGSRRTMSILHGTMTTVRTSADLKVGAAMPRKRQHARGSPVAKNTGQPRVKKRRPSTIQKAGVHSACDTCRHMCLTRCNKCYKHFCVTLRKDSCANRHECK